MSETQFRRSFLRAPLNSTAKSRLSISHTTRHDEPEFQHLFKSNDLSNINETLMLDGSEVGDRGGIKTDHLFTHFQQVLQTQNNDSEVFEIVLELTQVCRNMVDELQVEIERGAGGAHADRQRQESINWLKLEINTWRLLHALYYDRIMVQNDAAADDEMQGGPTLGGSEKEVMVQLYAINATLREYQLVVDWLEACHEHKDSTDLSHCHDRMRAWENTLFELEHLQGAAFGRGHEIVRQLDPDAPVREKRPLHALDEEDNVRLSRGIFMAVRCGSYDNALQLCKQYGQTWRAAILEGWRLHEDPNFEMHSVADEKIPIVGNPRRDIWKKCAWLLADSNKYDEYTRAMAGVFCGHLGSLKTLLHNDWHDLLWAYLKVQIDIRVESEIRGCCMKRYHTMPDDYWNGKMTLEQIFDELLVAKDVSVRDYAKSQLGIIQKHIILDNCGELLQLMCQWLDEVANKEKTLPPQQLRFMAHIVIFLRQIGRVERQQHADRIIAAYVESLIQRADPHLIAYYAATLPNALQVQLYSKYLEQIELKRPRELALEAALQAGLDVEQITRFTVENVRKSGSPLNPLHDGAPRAGEISAGDKRKINALQWLSHLSEQRGELLWQANAMIRSYLAVSKIECVRQTFAMIPSDVTNVFINVYDSIDNLPPREECSLKEYLSYKVYLAALDSFNEWTLLQQSRPQAPETQKSNTPGKFTERMAFEHKELNYRNDLVRWEHKIKEQRKLTSDVLYNVLLFPEKGWLVDPFVVMESETASQLNWEHRQIQMEKLRSICIPEIVLLLHDVLYKSGDYAGCVRLADEIASEERQLYKAYTKHKLAELLSKISDASLELLNNKLDPWGYPITT